MPDFRIDDTAPEHRKMRSAGPAAIGVWAMAGAYSMGQGTDGWVPQYWVQTWPGGRKCAERLVSVGLWWREDRDGIRGYAFHDWREYQRLAAEIEEEKRKARERMANLRHGRRSNGTEDVRPNMPRTASARDSNVHDSLSLSLSLSPSGGSLGGESSRSVGEQDPPPPEDQPQGNAPCGRHPDDDRACRGCRDVRLTDEATALKQRQADVTASLTARACPMCDADARLLEVGRFMPVSPAATCDHTTEHRLQVARARGTA